MPSSQVQIPNGTNGDLAPSHDIEMDRIAAWKSQPGSLAGLRIATGRAVAMWTWALAQTPDSGEPATSRPLGAQPDGCVVRYLGVPPSLQ